MSTRDTKFSIFTRYIFTTETLVSLPSSISNNIKNTKKKKKKYIMERKEIRINWGKYSSKANKHQTLLYKIF